MGELFSFFGQSIPSGVVERCFDLAWIWKWDPRVALDLSFDELALYEEHTARILEEVASQQEPGR